MDSQAVSPIQPRPLLKQPLVHKKKRGSDFTPDNRKVPPKPTKSATSVRRLFTEPLSEKPHTISFKSDHSSCLDDGYDESRTESYFEQMFEVQMKIGSGHFGEVFMVRCKSDRMLYAVKRNLHKFKGKSDRDRKLQEVAKHEQLPKHANLVEFRKSWEEKQRLYIQLELCDCSLADLNNKYGELPEERIWDILADVLMGLEHLHSHNLVHMDIKPENIFLSHDGTSCKIGDFGLVVDLSQPDVGQEAIDGDAKYMAKELMQGCVTTAADIFSCGITMLELACDLDLPSSGSGFHALRQRVPYEDFEACLSDNLKQVITAMMHSDPYSRPTAAQLLDQHPILRSVAERRRRKKVFNETLKSVTDFVQRFYLSIFAFVSYLISLAFTMSRNEHYLDLQDANGPRIAPLPINDTCIHSKYSFFDKESIPSPISHRSPVSRTCPTSLIRTRTGDKSSKFLRPTSPLRDALPFTSTPLHSGSKQRAEAFSVPEFSDTDEEFDGHMANIGPKNLLDEFDRLVDDESEDSK